MPDNLQILTQFRDELAKWVKAMQIVGLDCAEEANRHAALEWAVSQLRRDEDDGA
jgi:hypothetical protein